MSSFPFPHTLFHNPFPVEGKLELSPRSKFEFDPECVEVGVAEGVEDGERTCWANHAVTLDAVDPAEGDGELMREVGRTATP